MKRIQSVKIALTGGIGTGKTTVARMLRLLRIPIFDADLETHELLKSNTSVIKFIYQICPVSVVGNSVNRSLLSKCVQEDSTLLKKLEEIIHPKIDQRREAFCLLHQNNPILIFEIPLLFEVGLEKNYDYIVITTCSEEVQQQRVLARHEMTAEKYKIFSQRQLPLNEKKKRADFVIQTDYSRVETFRQIRRIFENKCEREL